MTGRRFASLIAALLAATAVGACGGNEASSSEIVVWDSAGVRIVENGVSGLGAAPVWHTSASPRYRVGGARSDEGHDLFRVQDALLLRDGGLAVLDGGSREVRRFDSDGDLVWAYGRVGEGPGEFSAPISLALLPGDSLGVWDWARAGLVVLSADGEAAESGLVSQLPRGLRSELVRPLPGGGHVVRVLRTERASGAGWSTVPYTVHRVRPDGAVVDLGEYPWREVRLFPELNLVAGAGFSGTGRVFSARVGVGVARGIDCELELRDLNGELEARARWTCPDRRVTDTDIDVHRAAQLAAAESGDERTRVRRRLDEVPYADRFAPHGAVRSDSDGRIWVEEFARPGASGPVRWMVYDPSGRFLGGADLPRETVLEITESTVVTVDRDALGVEEVRVYDLVR